MEIVNLLTMLIIKNDELIDIYSGTLKISPIIELKKRIDKLRGENARYETRKESLLAEIAKGTNVSS